MRTARLLFLAWATAGFAAAADPTDADLKDRVLKLNKETTTLDAADAKLKELVKDKATTAKLVKIAAQLQKEAKEGEKPFRFYAGLVLAKSAHFVKDYDTAATFYQFCTDTAIDDLQAGDLIANAVESQLDFLWERKKYDKVHELCDRVLVLEGGQKLQRAKINFMERQIQATARQGDFDKALDKADKLAKAFDGHWSLISLKGWVQREAGKYDAAIETYKDVLDKLEADADAPKADKEKYGRGIKYVLSGVYLDDGKLDKATDLLQELVKADPENATFYNDLGFLWADNGQKLEESEKLVRKAIELDLAAKKKLAAEGKIDAEAAKKTNPAYADSLGWVLFKLKRYTEALPHLVEAAKDEEEGGHVEIWDHVADCYAALGQKKEALEAYQKALKMEDISKKDADRRKKVTEKVKKLKAELSKQ